MLLRILPLLIAVPLAVAVAFTVPAVQRVLLPPGDAIRELMELARSRPEPAPPLQQDVVYHRDLLRRYRLDVYGPLTTADGEVSDDSEEGTSSTRLNAPAPVIVFFHGGSWVRGDKITLLVVDRFLRRMREEGWFVVSVNYTTSAYRGIRGPVRNAYRALDWVHEHAADYGWDPERVGLYGVSAGAHLALMAASPEAERRGGGRAGRPQDPRPALVLAECAPADLVAMRDGDAFENSGTFGLFPEFRLRALSPVEHIDSDYPPVLIYHGDADDTVAYRQAEILSRALAEADVTHELVRYPGGNHAFLNYSDAQWYEQESRALRWMRSVFADGTPPAPETPPAELPLFTRRSDSP
ncbi:MAG: alpha/beta hydrolase [Alkalispirochaeta sp.]